MLRTDVHDFMAQNTHHTYSHMAQTGGMANAESCIPKAGLYCVKKQKRTLLDEPSTKQPLTSASEAPAGDSAFFSGKCALYGTGRPHNSNNNCAAV